MHSKATNNFKLGCSLIENHPNAAANRIYYAMYQILFSFAKKNKYNEFKQLQEDQGIKTSHKILRNYLRSKYCPKALFDEDKNKTYKLFDYYRTLRENADYTNENINASALKKQTHDVKIFLDFYT